MKTLTVREASRSLGECVDRVRSGKESYAIVKLGVPCALLVPVSSPGCNSHELADLLGQAGLAAGDARAFAKTVRKGRTAVQPLRNPWG